LLFIRQHRKIVFGLALLVFAVVVYAGSMGGRSKAVNGAAETVNGQMERLLAGNPEEAHKLPAPPGDLGGAAGSRSAVQGGDGSSGNAKVGKEPLYSGKPSNSLGQGTAADASVNGSPVKGRNGTHSKPAGAVSSEQPTAVHTPGSRDGSNQGNKAEPSSGSAQKTDHTSTESDSGGRIDINSASESRLTDLPGIGPSKAKAIIAYREKAGGFRTVDELQKVKGIGPKTFERLKDAVSVNGLH
jgi:competence protein ComEA